MSPKNKRQAHLSMIKTKRLSTQEAESEESAEDEVEEMEVEETEEEEPRNFKDRITMNDMSDLFELCKSHCPIKYLSVLVYTTLRSFGINWRSCDSFLKTIGMFHSYSSFF